MKILVLFIDMLRPNLLHTWNPAEPKTDLDDWIEKAGGTVYTRAYTPAPDTPRSQAAMWSSRYPKYNGCDVRTKYPMYNLNQPENNYLRVFKDAGYQLNFFISEPDRLLGEIPEDFTDSCNYSKGGLLAEFLSSLTPENDSLTYIVFDDVHHAVNDYYSSKKAISFGARQVRRCLTLINKTLNLNTFDFILIYSDHGFCLQTERMDSAFAQLGDGRCNVFLMTRKKGENTLTRDTRLHSVMDIGPTLCDVAGLEIPYDIDGFSLFSDITPEYLVINDHKTFAVSINQTIEYWAIYDKSGYVAVDCNLDWKAAFELTEEDINKYMSILQEKGDFFEENCQAAKIMNYYDRYISSSSIYFDGAPRRSHPSVDRWIKENIKRVAKPVVPLLRKLID